MMNGAEYYCAIVRKRRVLSFAENIRSRWASMIETPILVDWRAASFVVEEALAGAKAACGRMCVFIDSQTVNTRTRQS